MADKLLAGFLNNVKNPKPKPVKRAAPTDGAPAEKRQKADAQAPEPPAGQQAISIGDKLLVHGLNARPDLNGQRATAVLFVESSGRWRVRFGSGEEVALKAPNLTIESTGVTAAASQPVISAAAREVQVGSDVQLGGLKARPDLNGKKGLVIAHVPEKGRWRIEMEDSAEEVSIKSANLTVVGFKKVMSGISEMAAKFKKQETDDYAQFAQKQAQMDADAEAEKKRNEEEDKAAASVREEQLQWFAKSVDSDKTAQERGRDESRMRRKEQQHKGKTAQVYMSGYPMGLISDCTVRELFGKYGTVEGVKVYTDEFGVAKGDALITMGNQEKVEAAIRGLHNKEVKSGFRLIVQAPTYTKAKAIRALAEKKKAA